MTSGRGGIGRRAGAALGAATAAVAMSQSLFQRPVQGPGPAMLPGPGGTGAVPSDQPPPRINPVAELEGMSLYAIQPLSARQFRVHDLITIIVNQSSKIERDQTLDTKKNYTNKAALEAFPDLGKLLEFRLEAGRAGSGPGALPELNLTANNKFKGEGDYEREDRITARITAEVIDVKPNGSLVLEARATTISDKEEQTMILSGTCRSEDVSATNTVQSTQLADLKLETKHTGDVRDASKKGIIPRVLETIFNF